MREGSTEYAIFICFEIGMFAHNPLESVERLGNPNLEIPVSFYYGDIDWMDIEGGNRVVEINKFKDLSKVYKIKNSDHHMYLDNPQEFASEIIKDIEMTEAYYKSQIIQEKHHTGDRGDSESITETQSQ